MSLQKRVFEVFLVQFKEDSSNKVSDLKDCVPDIQNNSNRRVWQRIWLQILVNDIARLRINWDFKQDFTARKTSTFEKFDSVNVNKFLDGFLVIFCLPTLPDIKSKFAAYIGLNWADKKHVWRVSLGEINFSCIVTLCV